MMTSPRRVIRSASGRTGDEVSAARGASRSKRRGSRSRVSHRGASRNLLLAPTRTPRRADHVVLLEHEVREPRRDRV